MWLYLFICRYTLPNIEGAIAGGPIPVRRAEVQVLFDGRGQGMELFEFPRFNASMTMRPYNYVYCAAKASPDSSFLDTLVKVCYS